MNAFDVIFQWSLLLESIVALGCNNSCHRQSRRLVKGRLCVCVFFLLQYSVLTSNNLMIANGHFQHLLLPICQSFSVDLFRIWLAEMKKVCLISLPPAPRSQTQGAPKKLMIFCILSGGGWTNGSIITLDFECSRSFRSGTSYL